MVEPGMDADDAFLGRAEVADALAEEGRVGGQLGVDFRAGVQDVRAVDGDGDRPEELPGGVEHRIGLGVGVAEEGVVARDDHRDIAQVAVLRVRRVHDERPLHRQARRERPAERTLYAAGPGLGGEKLELARAGPVVRHRVRRDGRVRDVPDEAVLRLVLHPGRRRLPHRERRVAPVMEPEPRPHHPQTTVRRRRSFAPRTTHHVLHHHLDLHEFTRSHGCGQQA